MSMFNFLKSTRNKNEKFLLKVRALKKKGKEALEQEIINVCAQISAHVEELQDAYKKDINWSDGDLPECILLAKVITLGIQETVLRDWIERDPTQVDVDFPNAEFPRSFSNKAYHGYLYFYELQERFFSNGKIYVPLGTEKWMYDKIRKQLNVEDSEVELHLSDSLTIGLPREKWEFFGISIRF